MVAVYGKDGQVDGIVGIFVVDVAPNKGTSAFAGRTSIGVGGTGNDLYLNGTGAHAVPSKNIHCVIQIYQEGQILLKSQYSLENNSTVLTCFVEGSPTGSVFVEEIPRQHDHVAFIFFGKIQNLFQSRKGIIPSDIVGFGITQVVVRADEYSQRVWIWIFENQVAVGSLAAGGWRLLLFCRHGGINGRFQRSVIWQRWAGCFRLVLLVAGVLGSAAAALAHASRKGAAFGRRIFVGRGISVWHNAETIAIGKEASAGKNSI